ncbi:MAG TPA: MOSC N-terminal beta barrel domain-containing protein [Longimicrobium sp.]|nr:MOSC N-terminal beta barrel domain-containing protein [Longimicrobium sp.]
MLVGTVREIWRYPVKSMAGERLDACDVTPGGLPGDRGWALRDREAGEIRGAKYLPALMQCSAAYREPPADGRTPHVDITLPDGTRTASDAPDVDARLSALLGREVALCPLRPAADRAHYRRGHPMAPVIGRLSRVPALRPYLGRLVRMAGLGGIAREMMSRQPDEPFPDLSGIPPEVFEFTSPPGTYFDAYPLHLLTTASLAAMARLNPAAAWDVRRFRPNFLVETNGGVQGLAEAEWGGREIRVGGLKVRCAGPTVRCGMTTHAQDGLPKDPTVLRTIVREADQNLGAYASAVNSTRVAVGDAVELL